MAYTSTGERRVPRHDAPAGPEGGPLCPRCGDELVCPTCLTDGIGLLATADDAGELVASVRAVLRRLLVEPDRPVTADERRTLLALFGYADALDHELRELRDVTRRALATLRSGVS